MLKNQRRYLKKLRSAFYTVAMLLLCTFMLMGCHLDMWNQPRFAALQENDFFANSSAARMPVPGTIPYAGARRGWTAPVFATASGEAKVPSRMDAAFWTGKRDGALLADNYFPVSTELLKRGQERYNITCTPCHGYIGDGKGIVTQRGFPNPTSYHQDRIREVEDGYIFDVMTSGFGRMYSYASRVTAEDRWAIVAYIRALQYSQFANPVELPEADRSAAVPVGSIAEVEENVAVTDAH